MPFFQRPASASRLREEHHDGKLSHRDFSSEVEMISPREFYREALSVCDAGDDTQTVATFFNVPESWVRRISSADGPVNGHMFLVWVQ